MTQISTSQESTDSQQNNTPDKVSSTLLQPGLAAGRNERSRQISMAIHSKKECVSLDGNNQNFFLDQQHKSKDIADFLNGPSGLQKADHTISFFV